MKNLLNEQELQALRTHIAQSSRILICAHRGPDGDAVGSSLGWAEYLRQQGKQVDIVMPTPFPDFLRWMPGSQDIRFYARHEAEAEQVIAQADLIFCLDFNGLQRLQEMQAPVAAAQAKRIIIDHHLDPDRSIAAQVMSFPTRCSTSEIVCRLIIELGGWDELPQKAAVCLYTGFTSHSDDPALDEVISTLRTRGIDKDKIYRNVFNVYSEDRMRLTGYILYRKLRFYYNRHASIFALTREEMRRFHFIRGDAEGLVNMPLQVKGMRLSISLREDTERDVVRVSLRSVDDFPCNRMAEEFFHGGGHLNASGGELPFPLSEAMLTAERAIKAYADLL